MTWITARAINKLRQQVNQAWPDRDKASDGTIGDANHASKASDHNPWVRDSKNNRVVTAVDIDKDLTDTVKVGVLVDALVTNKDPRVKYIIWNSRMISSYAANGYEPWEWRPYSGSNKHKEHVHVSVKADEKHFHNEQDWDIAIHANTVAQPVPEPFSDETYTVQSGDNLTKIAKSYGVSLEALAKKNNIADPNKIKPGQVLKIR